MMREESRKLRRFAVQLPCKLWNDEDKSDGTILNLAVQGCGMTAEQLPSASTYVALEIDFLNGEAPANIELAAVRWVSGHRCGLEFIRVSPDMLIKLKAFHLLLEQTA